MIHPCPAIPGAQRCTGSAAARIDVTPNPHHTCRHSQTSRKHLATAGVSGHDAPVMRHATAPPGALRPHIGEALARATRPKEQAACCRSEGAPAVVLAIAATGTGPRNQSDRFPDKTAPAGLPATASCCCPPLLPWLPPWRWSRQLPSAPPPLSPAPPPATAAAQPCRAVSCTVGGQQCTAVSSSSGSSSTGAAPGAAAC